MKKTYFFVAVFLVLLIVVSVYLIGNFNSKVSQIAQLTPPSYSDNMDMSGMNHPIIGSEQDFINAMIPHHQEAVETSKYVLANYPETKIKDFLNNVIIAQTQEIEVMKLWYKEWFGVDYNNTISTPGMMGSIYKYSGANLETAYIQGMIIHHNAAIMMARNLLPIVEHPELKQMANNIITNQTSEVNYLKSL